MSRFLTDRRALMRNRSRALRDPALFLHQTAADDMKDRLAGVNKSFTTTAVVAGFPDFWSKALNCHRTVGDSDVLDLPENALDLVVHAMAMHWSNDPVGQMIQIRRALRPDGLFLGIFPGGRSLHELRACLAQAESDLRGGLSARVAPMAEIRDLGALLQRAGFAMPVADSFTLTARYETPMHLMRDLRAMGEGNALQARPRHFTRRDVMVRACQIYTRRFAGPDGRVPASFELITLTGWAPAAGQPQPLRPGSAAARLADALGVAERPLKP